MTLEKKNKMSSSSLETKYFDLLRQCETTTSPSNSVRSSDDDDSLLGPILAPFKDGQNKDNVDGDGVEGSKIRCRTVNALRRLVLLEGMPMGANDLNSHEFGRCSLRGLVWKALLGIGTVDVQEYTALVRKGPSENDSRIREDTKRTFSKNDDFIKRVPNEKLVRVLNAYIHSCGNNKEMGVYNQSMSLIVTHHLSVVA